MNTIKSLPEYQDFKEFYLKEVAPYKEKNPTHIRLDGKILGASRNTVAYFWYLDKKWKINAETQIDKLKLAYELAQNTDEPFVVKNARDHKGQYLEIKGQPIRGKKFYVYNA